LLHAGADDLRTGDQRVVDVPDDDVAALVEPEVGMVRALLQQGKPEVDEIARALLHVVHAVQNGLYANDGHHSILENVGNRQVDADLKPVSLTSSAHLAVSAFMRCARVRVSWYSGIRPIA